MHEDKIWAVDIKDSDEGLAMLTGGGDSRVKLWADNTVEYELG